MRIFIFLVVLLAVSIIPAQADTLTTVTIDFNNLTLGTTPDFYPPFFGVASVRTSSWLAIDGLAWDFFGSIDDHPENVFFPEYGRIAPFSSLECANECPPVEVGNRAVQVTSPVVPYEIWAALPIFDDFPDLLDFPVNRVRIDVDFLAPVLEFTVDAISADFTSILFYDGFTATGNPFQGTVRLRPPYTWTNINVHAPSNAYITGFHFAQFDKGESLEIGMDNLTVTTKVPEAGSSAGFLGFGCVGLALLVTRRERIPLRDQRVTGNG